jgi:hypothetical protein
MATNPQIALGTLNRLRTSAVFPGFTSLNITASYMSKKFIHVTLDENPFAEGIETATGIVVSPEPYVLGTVTIGLLRTTGLAAAWLAQAKATSVLGSMEIHSDTSAFPALTIHNAYIKTLDPGPYDGTNPETPLILRGVFYVNNDLWNLI